MVRPSLEYASTVWETYQTTLDKDLEQVQRRVAHFVYNEYHDASPGCVTSLLDQLQWEPLNERRTKNRLQMAYKIQYGLVDVDASQ